MLSSELNVRLLCKSCSRDRRYGIVSCGVLRTLPYSSKLLDKRNSLVVDVDVVLVDVVDVVDVVEVAN